MDSSQHLEKLVHELFRQLYLKKRNSGNMTQGKILKLLYKKGDISQKDMQDKLQIQSGSMSEIINKLESKELLIRQKDEKDKRKMILHLTEKGKRDVEHYTQNYQNDVIQYFDVLTCEEKENLEKILQKLLNQNERNKDGKRK